MLTLGVTILAFAFFGGMIELAHCVPTIAGRLRTSDTTAFEVKAWSAFFGAIFGGVLGFGIAYGLGQHFYPAPYELTVLSFNEVDSGQSYLVMEETSDYNVITETVPAALSKVTRTIGMARVKISGRFRNPQMNLWFILPDEPHYHFFLPVNPSASPEQKTSEPHAISTSRGALIFIKRAILSL